MKSLLAQQMEKFDGLEQKFDMLLRHLNPQDQHTPPETNPPQRKRKSDKTLHRNSGGCRIQISNAGTPTPISDPPIQGQAKLTKLTFLPKWTWTTQPLREESKMMT